MNNAVSIIVFDSSLWSLTEALGIKRILIQLVSLQMVFLLAFVALLVHVSFLFIASTRALHSVLVGNRCAIGMFAL